MPHLEYRPGLQSNFNLNYLTNYQPNVQPNSQRFQQNVQPIGPNFTNCFNLIGNENLIQSINIQPTQTPQRKQINKFLDHQKMFSLLLVEHLPILPNQCSILSKILLYLVQRQNNHFQLTGSPNYIY